MKVALIYGYAEGPRIGKKFRESLVTSGHELVGIDKAEVIIAHSGGSFLIPDNHAANLVVLVDVPYYDSHRSFIKKLTKRVAEEGWSRESISKFAWNNWYVISDLKRSHQMYKAVIRGTFYGLAGKKVLVIRNSQDVFGKLAQDKEEAQKAGWVATELPGTHDDLWINPEPYIKLAEKHL